MRDPYPVHGPRRAWYWPARITGCRCGVDAFPCPTERRRINREAAEIAAALARYDDDGSALLWQHEERRRWRGAR